MILRHLVHRPKVRTPYAGSYALNGKFKISSDSALLTYWIEANAFLQHMVRRVVGMIVDVGRGARTVEQFEPIFVRQNSQVPGQ